MTNILQLSLHKRTVFSCSPQKRDGSSNEKKKCAISPMWWISKKSAYKWAKRDRASFTCALFTSCEKNVFRNFPSCFVRKHNIACSAPFLSYIYTLKRVACFFFLHFMFFIVWSLKATLPDDVNRISFIGSNVRVIKQI